MNRPEPPPKQATRIQRKNRKAILDAALRGLLGPRLSRLDHRPHRRAGRPLEAEPPLLLPLQGRDLSSRCWRTRSRNGCSRSRELDPAGDPIEEIGRYIDAKLEMSRTRPEASRLFANEILHGAPAIGDFLRGPLKALVDEKAAVIDGWIADGRLAPIDPRHLIMMIWAVTQHYADFDVQVQAVLGAGRRAGAALHDMLRRR